MTMLVASMRETDPTDMREMWLSANKDEWILALWEELGKIKAYGTYKLLPPSEVPAGAKIFNGRPVFKTKYGPAPPGTAYGPVVQRKARVVVQSLSHMLEQGVHYAESHASTVQWNSQRLLLALGVQYKLKMALRDLEPFYLKGDLDHEMEPICMRQVKGCR